MSRQTNRVVAVTLLLLALATLRVTASPSNATVTSETVGSPTTTTVSNTTTTTTTVSSCGRCRDRGDCAQAYRGGPGVFCGGSRLAQALCCCASSELCSTGAHHHLQTSACECSAPKPTATSTSPPSHIGIFSTHKIGWTVVAMGALGVVFAAYLYTTRRDRGYHYREPRGRATQPSRVYRPPRIPTSSSRPLPGGKPASTVNV